MTYRIMTKGIDETEYKPLWGKHYDFFEHNKDLKIAELRKIIKQNQFSDLFDYKIIKIETNRNGDVLKIIDNNVVTISKEL